MKNAFCLALLLLQAAPAFGTDRVLRVCSLHLAPQTMQSADGSPTGYAVEILQHVARKLQWSIRIDYMPWARVVSETRAGRCDMAMTVLQFKDYAEFMLFPHESILDQKNVLVVRRGSKIRYDGNLEQFMRQHSIGLYVDKRVNDKFERLRAAPWARVDTAPSAVLNTKKLLFRRFDAIIENDLSVIFEMRKLGQLDDIEILSPPLSVTPAYIVFSQTPESKARSRKYDEALANFKKTARFKALTNRYLPETSVAD
ncbi:transporter substrate-binding domain-containing protein [Pseudoduganella sp. LjRoot289]|uniref:substrate-binding periplasmic protein n=1 Tax=Pseudoduganella sp. LjRoot289 TaxID=3342314 RepID=UPI003ECE252A